MKIILPKDKEDVALMLGGKKMNLNKGYFNQLGVVLKLNEKQINGVYKRLQKWLPNATQLISSSFLTEGLKSSYTTLVNQRVFLFKTNNSD